MERFLICILGKLSIIFAYEKPVTFVVTTCYILFYFKSSFLCVTTITCVHADIKNHKWTWSALLLPREKYPFDKQMNHCVHIHLYGFKKKKKRLKKETIKMLLWQSRCDGDKERFHLHFVFGRVKYSNRNVTDSRDQVVFVTKLVYIIKSLISLSISLKV